MRQENTSKKNRVFGNSHRNTAELLQKKWNKKRKKKSMRTPIDKSSESYEDEDSDDGEN